MPVAYITRRARFSAAHRLHADSLSEGENLKIFGQCNNIYGHGHNYELKVTIRGEIDPETGMVMNLTDLRKDMEELVINHVDHKHLNHDIDFLKEVNPTAENLAVAFWQRLLLRIPKELLYEVTVIETENNSASYRGD